MSPRLPATTLRTRRSTSSRLRTWEQTHVRYHCHRLARSLARARDLRPDRRAAQEPGTRLAWLAARVLRIYGLRLLHGRDREVVFPSRSARRGEDIPGLRPVLARIPAAADLRR